MNNSGLKSAVKQGDKPPPLAVVGVWPHLGLSCGCTALGLWGGGLAGAMLVMGLSRLAGQEAGAWVACPGIPLFFACAIGGLWLSRWLLFRYILARCPRCGGPADYEGGKPIRYHCRVCGHVHNTPLAEGR